MASSGVTAALRAIAAESAGAKAPPRAQGGWARAAGGASLRPASASQQADELLRRAWVAPAAAAGAQDPTHVPLLLGTFSAPGTLASVLQLQVTLPRALPELECGGSGGAGGSEPQTSAEAATAGACFALLFSPSRGERAEALAPLAETLRRWASQRCASL